jgi:hypothetical protein
MVIELLSSEARRSQFWRQPLQEALRALNFGQIIEPLVPTAARRRAEFFETLSWKKAAICHVNYLVGSGVKKHVALERVARALNQSPETLRTWEKFLLSDEEFEANAYAARLAGEFAEEIEANKIDELEKLHGDAGFRNRSYWRLAGIQHARFKNISLERIRDKLNEIRREKKAVGKKRLKPPEIG